MERSGQNWQVSGRQDLQLHWKWGQGKGGIKADLHLAYITSQEVAQFPELRNSLKRGFLSSHWCYTIHKERDD